MHAEILFRLALQLSTAGLTPAFSPTHAAVPATSSAPAVAAALAIQVPTPGEVGALAARALDAPKGALLEEVEYSEWYYRRLTLHRWGSYTMLPLFVAQYVVGSQLAKGGDTDGLEDLHPALALGVGALFTSNTITGAWNLWDGRKDPHDRKRRFAHATLMMLADAGFLTTALLGDKLDEGGNVNTHRTMAISSMAVATVSWAMMLDIFRDE